MVGDGVSMERRVRPHVMFAVEGVRYREIYGRPPLVLYIILLYFKILGYVFKNIPDLSVPTKVLVIKYGSKHNNSYCLRKVGPT